MHSTTAGSLSITYAISAPQNETINGYLSETAKGIEEYKAQ